MAGVVITIAQQKGGAGKADARGHLALAWAGQKRRVALVDIDPQASLSAWYELRQEMLGSAKSRLISPRSPAGAPPRRSNDAPATATSW